MHYKNLLTLLLILISVSLMGQGVVPENWFHMDPETDDFNGVSTDRTYKELLKGMTSSPVIVAVIDSGVDAEHEDLEKVMWVNEDEIAGNGIDDDGNGYVDDIHGWNFIGGPDGQNVAQDNLEITRLYRKYHNMYKDVENPTGLPADERREYGMYLGYKKAYMKNREKAKANMDQFESQKQSVIAMVDAVEDALGGKELTLENVQEIDAGDNQTLAQGKGILLNVLKEQSFEDFEQLREDIAGQFEGAMEYYSNQYNYWYNIDFDPRHIVGDDYDDPDQRIYGNNDVEGPDAAHGTHVAGIIGAVRDNDLGMNGVADNVRIMSVRAVPDGDERDKDVANAIRYAVDNGASIINMSFGKGYSWNKEVVDDAVKYASKNDVLLVHAAGNSGQNNDETDNFPNDTYDSHFFLCSGHSKNWLEVGALSWEKGEELPAGFSNYGTGTVDLFAPGVAIYSTTPDNGYDSFQGTSMASPVVAGVASVLRSYFPDLSAKQVREIILKSAIEQDMEVIKPGSDESVSFDELSATGGVVNLYKAVELASKKSKGQGSKPGA